MSMISRGFRERTRGKCYRLEGIFNVEQAGKWKLMFENR